VTNSIEGMYAVRIIGLSRCTKGWGTACTDECVSTMVVLDWGGEVETKKMHLVRPSSLAGMMNAERMDPDMRKPMRRDPHRRSVRPGGREHIMHASEANE
jgi:hypothetical protein